ncbi:gamma carbonic anhydrase family protein [Iodidimonas sp. SYSU 1G8]|uniref:gamma carbonic anhydrase family protein n=1 Tax=Iodidimonas sp. SYSU 1G8 TaxID=3133967 RepID=UPI0031FE4809
MPLYAIGDHHPVLESDDVWIAPSADIMGQVVIRKGANIWFNTTLRGDDNLITVGEDANIQDGAVIHVDRRFPCTIGRNVTIGHQAMVHGCTIGENSLIGIGAVILDGAKIGKNTLIGANTLIGNNKEIPDGVLVLGAPGKIVRELNEEDIRMLEMSGRSYAEKGRMFRKSLKVVG